ncbi:hypothetical protein A0J61_04033 [Choanephora cucurbitarum]|uniref:Uncharacterized protein n=1 Tax=Choanephora cucurbitarum TaxID=101091 RepID=A0A1C7NGN8_9FUNG|nr:hypothetical protein A0J61_04033 [Choanephora cucurbitarum]
MNAAIAVLTVEPTLSFSFAADPTSCDPSNFDATGQLKVQNLQVFFPEEFSLSQTCKHQLHGRVYSTYPTGVHFNSVDRTRVIEEKETFYKLYNLWGFVLSMDTVDSNNKLKH